MGQFRITTMLSWTAVILAVLVTFNVESLFGSSGPEVFSIEESLIQVTFVILFMLPATTCIPFLIDQALEPKNRHRSVLDFSLFWKAWITLFIGAYSMLMLVLATPAFVSEWKGQKGPNWSYYMLESVQGMTLWPIYLAGVIMFSVAVCKGATARQSPIHFVMVLVQAAISLWYTFACLAQNFAPDHFWIVPGSCAICYCLYAAVVLRHKEWALSEVRNQITEIVAATVVFLVSIAAKFPLTKAFYDQLPDVGPQNCFIVTAATRGHRAVVRTWYDESAGRTVNQQLLNFWMFENVLRSNLPVIHFAIRKVYNMVGPRIARLIVFKWQADLVYWLLKPIEFVATLLTRRSGP